MKKIALLCISLAALTTSIAHARVCSVTNFDTSGCKIGDELLYLPQTMESDRLPIEFVASKCDMTKSVALNDAGVACIYAGEKDAFNGHLESKRIAYAKVYESAGSLFSGFKQMSNGAYWKIKEDGRGELVKLGERIELAEKNCVHDINGNEKLGTYFKDAAPIEKLTEDHYVYKLQPKHGAVIEVIGETYHVFVKVK